MAAFTFFAVITEETMDYNVVALMFAFASVGDDAAVGAKLRIVSGVAATIPAVIMLALLGAPFSVTCV